MVKNGLKSPGSTAATGPSGLPGNFPVFVHSFLLFVLPHNIATDGDIGLYLEKTIFYTQRTYIYTTTKNTHYYLTIPSLRT